jgi:hypothetical protein
MALIEKVVVDGNGLTFSLILNDANHKCNGVHSVTNSGKNVTTNLTRGNSPNPVVIRAGDDVIIPVQQTDWSEGVSGLGIPIIITTPNIDLGYSAK